MIKSDYHQPEGSPREETSTNGQNDLKNMAEPEIVDIRQGSLENDIVESIRQGILSKKANNRTLPTILLYDELGLQLFEEITFLDEYYPTNAEIEVLNASSDRIVERVKTNSLLIELGSGNLRKVNILLQAFERARKSVRYHALDLSLPELQRTLLAAVQQNYAYVTCIGLFGTYDDCLEWLKAPEQQSKSKIVLTLGSSVGNFKRNDAARFISQFGATLNDGDAIILGVDCCQSPEKVFRAYNDQRGVTHRFILNGLTHANRLLGRTEFVEHQWKVVGLYDKSVNCYRAYISPTEDTQVMGQVIVAGEKVLIEECYKYSESYLEQLYRAAGVSAGAAWYNSSKEHALRMLFKTKVDFGISENSSVTNPVPTLREWQELWKVWTLVTRTVVPKESFLSAPSSLRQPYIFYLGHIPASLDIHLAKVTGEALNQPASYARIFGQGIGPDVDDPSRCHDHSKVPSVWPQLGEIEAYEQQVRKRLEALYEKNVAIKLPKVDAALRIEFEHQALHLETILYGVVQSDVINPPPGLIRPDFEQIAEFAKSKWTSNEWCSIPRAELAIGLETDGAEQNMNGSLDSGIVKHVRTVTIGAFEAKAYPITISEYVDYLIDTGDSRLPACWIDHIPEESAESPSKFSTNGHVNGYAHSNGAVSAVTSFVEGKAIRTLWGPVPLKYALQWPAFASYDDLSACAHWLGGRIPSEDEARSIYRHAKLLRRDDADNAIGAKIPAVNAHLINDGVEESPPQISAPKVVANGATSSPQDLCVDLNDADTAFKNWYPTPVTHRGQHLCGRGEFGGVWEWTSTVLESDDGHDPTESYPCCSAGYSDGQHNVVLGGSWATHPRIAERNAFVNCYRRAHPDVWAGARLVRDLRGSE